MFAAMKLAKAGYCGGNPLTILQMPTNIVIDMLDYERFENDYETAYIEMNKEGGQ